MKTGSQLSKVGMFLGAISLLGWAGDCFRAAMPNQKVAGSTAYLVLLVAAGAIATWRLGDPQVTLSASGKPQSLWALLRKWDTSYFVGAAVFLGTHKILKEGGGLRAAVTGFTVAVVIVLTYCFGEAVAWLWARVTRQLGTPTRFVQAATAPTQKSLPTALAYGPVDGLVCAVVCCLSNLYRTFRLPMAAAAEGEARENPRSEKKTTQAGGMVKKLILTGPVVGIFSGLAVWQVERLVSMTWFVQLAKCLAFLYVPVALVAMGVGMPALVKTWKKGGEETSPEKKKDEEGLLCTTIYVVTMTFVVVPLFVWVVSRLAFGLGLIDHSVALSLLLFFTAATSPINHAFVSQALGEKKAGLTLVFVLTTTLVGLVATPFVYGVLKF